MAELNIRISTDNAAFHGQEGSLPYEVNAVMQAITFQLHQGETSGTLRDSNGNRCGEWSLGEPDAEGRCSGCGERCTALCGYCQPLED